MLQPQKSQRWTMAQTLRRKVAMLTTVRVKHDSLKQLQYVQVLVIHKSSIELSR